MIPGYQASLQILLLTVTCFIHCVTSTACDASSVTYTEMENIVKGRCYDYQRTRHPEYFCETGLKNCNELWDKLSKAFIGVPDCHVTAESYSDFIDAANHMTTGKRLFYSGVYGMAQRYSAGGRYVTVETTLAGYMVDRIKFCGENASSTDQCEHQDIVTCPQNAVNGFWQMASINFARTASGQTYVLLNASREPIVKNSSYFTKYEAPNLGSSGKVTGLTALLINPSPRSNRDPCNNEASMKYLQTIIEQQNIAFDCIENPSDLVYLFCMDNQDSELCGNVNQHLQLSGVAGLRQFFYTWLSLGFIFLLKHVL